MAGKVVAVFPWWPHTPNEEETVALASIALHNKLSLVGMMPHGCEPPTGLVFSEIIRFPAEYFKSGWTYSALLLSHEFWEAFKRWEYIVILQSDVLLLRSLDIEALTPFWGFDYVGAPWVGESRGEIYLREVGNGGFSLRSVEAASKCLNSRVRLTVRSFRLCRTWRGACAFSVVLACWILRAKMETLSRKLLKLGVHEDVFYSKIATCSVRIFRTPSGQLASLFALERKADEIIKLMGVSPIGVHAWKKNGFIRKTT